MDMNDNDPVKKAVNDAYAGAHEGGNGPGVVTSSMQQHTGEIEGEAVSAGNAIISTSARGGMEGDAAARMAEVLRGDGIDDKVSQELEQESDCSGQKGGAGVDTPWSAQTARTSLGMCPKVPTLSLQTFFRAAANLTNLSTCYFTDDVRMLRARRQWQNAIGSQSKSDWREGISRRICGFLLLAWRSATPLAYCWHIWCEELSQIT
jgi:hypothetical protein